MDETKVCQRKCLTLWDTKQMRKSVLLMLPLLLMTTSCASSSNSEATKSAFLGGCTLVTSSYDTWAATGQSTATETGQLGRENLESSLNTAQDSLLDFVSQSDIEDARNATSNGISASVTGAQIFLQMKEIQSLINNWESVVQYPNWTPGRMATFDASMNSLKASCDSFQKE